MAKRSKPRVPALKAPLRSRKIANYRVTPDEAGGVTIALDTSDLDAPPYSFAANWCDVEIRPDGFTFTFGQTRNGKLYSQVDVVVGHKEFSALIATFEGFFESIRDGQYAVTEGSVAEHGDAPTVRFVSERASAAIGAFAGSEAQIDFYRIEPWDIHRIRNNDIKGVRGARPVVSVGLSTGMLRYLLMKARDLDSIDLGRTGVTGGSHAR